MISIFIPVLWVCINANCEFLQALRYFPNEAQCQQSVNIQKQYIRRQADQDGFEINVLEGTCILVNIKKEYI